KIEMQVELLNDAPPLSLATCKWGRFFTPANTKIFQNLAVYKNFNSLELFFNSLADSKGFFPPHTYLLKREIIVKSGPWLEFLSMNQDAEFMIRVICNAESILFSE